MADEACALGPAGSLGSRWATRPSSGSRLRQEAHVPQRTGTVTGSKYLLETAEQRWLVAGGVFQDSNAGEDNVIDMPLQIRFSRAPRAVADAGKQSFLWKLEHTYTFGHTNTQ